MIPQLFYLGPLPINSFGLMVALAFFAGIERLRRSFGRNGIAPELAETFVFTGGVVGLVGARLWFIAENYNEFSGQLGAALFSTAGFTFYGGFILSALTLIGLCWFYGIKLTTFLDSVGPTLALGYAIGRLGCQLSGDGCYGIATTSFLGMSYANGVVPTPPGVLVYPTPLYESLFSLALVFVLSALEQRLWWQAPLRRFAAYLFLLGSERFLIEFLRINPTILYGLSEAQVIAGVLMAVALVIGLVNSRRKKATIEY